jgi:hypothetical protein
MFVLMLYSVYSNYVGAVKHNTLPSAYLDLHYMVSVAVAGLAFDIVFM